MIEKIHFFYINMDKNSDRREDMENKLSRLNISYSRIIGVDGYKMSTNDKCKEMLRPINEKIGCKLECIHYNQEWTYDGTLETSFPGLHLYAHWGTKGLTMSNLIAFEESLLIDKEWICILEDDAEINKKSLDTILNFINNSKNNIFEIILLDNRWWGFGGTSGMLYKNKSMRKFINDLHPLSDFSIISEKNCEKYMLDHFKNSSGGDLKHWDVNNWDWKLWKYIKYANIPFYQLPCIKSGKYPTTL
jgi:hypothetical protein